VGKKERRGKSSIREGGRKGPFNLREEKKKSVPSGHGKKGKGKTPALQKRGKRRKDLPAAALSSRGGIKRNPNYPDGKKGKRKRKQVPFSNEARGGFLWGGGLGCLGGFGWLGWWRLEGFFFWGGLFWWGWVIFVDGVFLWEGVVFDCLVFFVCFVGGGVVEISLFSLGGGCCVMFFSGLLFVFFRAQGGEGKRHEIPKCWQGKKGRGRKVLTCCLSAVKKRRGGEKKAKLRYRKKGGGRGILIPSSPKPPGEENDKGFSF